MLIAMPHCLRLLAHCALTAADFALLNAGNNIAARMAIMAITTRSSINVNAIWPRADETPPSLNVCAGLPGLLFIWPFAGVRRRAPGDPYVGTTRDVVCKKERAGWAGYSNSDGG